MNPEDEAEHAAMIAQFREEDAYLARTMGEGSLPLQTPPPGYHYVTTSLEGGGKVCRLVSVRSPLSKAARTLPGKRGGNRRRGRRNNPEKDAEIANYITQLRRAGASHRSAVKRAAIKFHQHESTIYRAEKRHSPSAIS